MSKNKIRNEGQSKPTGPLEKKIDPGGRSNHSKACHILWTSPYVQRETEKCVCFETESGLDDANNIDDESIEYIITTNKRCESFVLLFFLIFNTIGVKVLPATA